MRKIKKGILALCITAGLFSLSACSSSQEETASSLDLNTSTQISMVSESLISQITSIPEEELEGMIAVQEENGEMALAEAMTSWQNVMPDTGAFVKVENSVADKADDEYVCQMVVQFEERLADCDIYYDTKSGEVTSISISPRYTVGERLAKAGMNTLIGMGTVFLVLIFISLIIGCFKYINLWESKQAAGKNQSGETGADQKQVAVSAAESGEENLVDDLELVAVITAAIAASTGTSSDGLVVRSIRRVPGAKWKRV